MSSEEAIRRLEFARSRLDRSLQDGSLLLLFSERTNIFLTEEEFLGKLPLGITVLGCALSPQTKARLLELIGILPPFDSRSEAMVSHFAASLQLGRRVGERLAESGTRPLTMAEVPEVHPSIAQDLKTQFQKLRKLEEEVRSTARDEPGRQLLLRQKEKAKEELALLQNQCKAYSAARHAFLELTSK
jgi:hypothetical protein